MLKKSTLFSCAILISLLFPFKGTNGNTTNSSSITLSAGCCYVEDNLLPLQEYPKGNKHVFQLISHGRPGELLLGGKWRNAQQIVIFLQDRHLLTPAVRQLNVYGCEFAKGAKGLQAVQYLEKALRVSVAASTNITGKDGDWLLEYGNIDASGFSGIIQGNLQCAGTIGGTGTGDDLDGDGICNGLDIDDDNDGVLDAVESPSCFYTNADALAIATVTVTSGLTTNDTQIDGDIQALHDNTTATTNSINSAQALAGANIYTVKFPTKVKLSVLNVTGTTASWGTNSTAKLRGSNDGTTWVDLTAALSTVSGATKAFTVTINAAEYLYYRIEGVAVVTTTATIVSQDISWTADNSSYVQSAHPKPICTRDTDNDGFLNHQDLDSDGDGCSDALESGTTTSTTPNFTFGSSQTDANSNGFNDALQSATNNNDYNDTYTYVPATNSLIGKCLPEICNDHLDNDVDGYVDDYDSDCTIIVPTCTAPAGSNSAFSVVRGLSSNLVNSNASSPTVGDINGDGMPEIIVAAANATGYRIYQGDGSDFNNDTVDIKIPLNTIVGFPTVQAAIADINRDGTVEIITVGDDGFVYVFPNTGGNTATGTYMLKSDLVFDNSGVGSGSPRVTDLNEDGIPEIILGNAVFTFNATYTALNRVVANDNTIPDGSTINQEWDKDIVAIDILPQYPGKEIVAAGVIYTVDLTTGTRTKVKTLSSIESTWAENTDGAVAVADMNLDGNLDVVITSQTGANTIVWSPNTDTVLFKVADGGGFIGMPVVADIYNEVVNNGKPVNLPEFIFLSGTTLKCFNVGFNRPYLDIGNF